MPPARVWRGRFDAARRVGRGGTGTREAEVAAAAAGPFRQARGPRAVLSLGAATDQRYLVGHGATDVEHDIVDEENGPGPNGAQPEQELSRPGQQSRSGEAAKQ